jgi:hypothetical protein
MAILSSAFIAIGGQDSVAALGVLAPTVLAQAQDPNAQAQQACAVCGGGIATGFTTLVILFVTVVALNIALDVWVARDAKSRGMDSSVLWMFLVMFTSIIGLTIYLFSRPQGELIECHNCHGKRLKASAICPHCHTA